MGVPRPEALEGQLVLGLVAGAALGQHRTRVVYGGLGILAEHLLQGAVHEPPRLGLHDDAPEHNAAVSLLRAGPVHGNLVLYDLGRLDYGVGTVLRELG